MSFDDVRAIEWIARRAPSPHNTQPWRLVYGEDRIRLDFDPARHLAHSDPAKRDLLLALGGFIEALMIAASEQDVGLDFVPDIDLAEHRIGWFHGTRTLYRTPHRSADIVGRRTSRLRFQPACVDKALRLSLEAALSQADRIAYLAGEDVRDLLGAADRHLLDTPPIAAEFRRWSRLTPDEIAATDDGMSAQCLALGRIEAWTLSALLSNPVYRWFRRFRLSALVGNITRSLVPKQAQLIALIRPAFDPFQTLDAGRTLLRLWLTLGRAGLHAHPLSQLLDCPETHAAICERVKPGAENEIMCIFRFGISKPPAESRRLGDEPIKTVPALP